MKKEDLKDLSIGDTVCIKGRCIYKGHQGIVKNKNERKVEVEVIANGDVRWFYYGLLDFVEKGQKQEDAQPETEDKIKCTFLTLDEVLMLIKNKDADSIYVGWVDLTIFASQGVKFKPLSKMTIEGLISPGNIFIKIS